MSQAFFIRKWQVSVVVNHSNVSHSRSCVMWLRAVSETRQAFYDRYLEFFEIRKQEQGIGYDMLPILSGLWAC